MTSAHEISSTRPHWKGEEASYKTIHWWMNKYYPRTGVCEDCGATSGKGRRGTAYAFLHHPAPHTRDRDDYRELCRRCHHLLDEPHAQRGSRLRRQKALKGKK